MNSEAIRRAFVDYFVEHGHLHLPGLPLVPNDPSITTLFTIAGMQQMIPYFLGSETPPAPNMVTVQPTIRTNDIGEVGDATHCTFFEMLGNFSVGQYFKREAIFYTWDFLTRVMGIPRERFWAVTYPGDEEAREAWMEVGVPADRIGSTPDNWWGPPGPYGPCGPNSEIHYDRGLQYGCGVPDCRPETECCERFVEVWNDVFMTYYQEQDGERRPLPWKNIDTGMGFERLTMVVQGVETMYDTDIYQHVISAVVNESGTPYGSDERVTRSLRIIADHSRAVALLTAEGVMPSAEGRGYVLRRLLRRASLHGRLLGVDRPFLTIPIEAVVEILGTHYTILRERSEHIVEVVRGEERRFLQTLDRGLGIFETMAESAARNGSVISGQDAFVLSDTYGFPLELTVELAGARQLRVDEEGFKRALQEQRERARRGAGSQVIGASPETYAGLAERVEPSKFTGYDELKTMTEVGAIVRNGESVTRAEAGDTVQIVLAATPFYAEAGGQVGDTGTIRADSGVVQVLDTRRPYASFIAHEGRVLDGSISVGDAVEAEVDAERRLHILPHHSGTHLLHKALQEVLGPDATQAGSLVAPDRLRFDFNWPRPVSAEELREVQDRINAAIWANLPVRREVKPYAEAIADGAMALFGEKYGDLVRVVSMGDWSKELCGGTHVAATGDIGLLLITSETGSAAGVRRIEALAGAAAYAYVHNLRERIDETAEALETAPDGIVERARRLTTMLQERDREIQVLLQKLADREAAALVERAEESNGVRIVAATVDADSIDFLQACADAVRSRLPDSVVALGANIAGSPGFVLAVSRGLRGRGYNAGQILRESLKPIGGGGGGSPEFAQGGARDSTRIDEGLRRAVDLIRRQAEA
ncbi:MAG TPA: alanine--tRNA ligase [Chloroflexota bacterium]|nr:alanine--tRNA ligase [Chloroflexota bacterium]